MKLALAIMATLGGALAALTLFVLTIAGSANSRPEQQAAIKACLWGSSVGGTICFAIAIALMVYGRPLTATAIGGLPIVAFVGVMIYAFLPS